MIWRPLIGFVLLTGCMTARPDAGIDASGNTSDPVLYTPGAPGVGAHALAFNRLHATTKPTLTTSSMTTTTGSTIIAGVGRGDASAFALPTDNKGNAPYPQLDTTHPYTRWSTSGTALYAATSVDGGAGHVIQVTAPPEDEVTLAAVEVLETSRIQDVQWNEVLAGQPLTSRSVTTTGPATLVAFWWGDADVDGDKAAVPDQGFRVVDSLLASGALVQTAVAFKNVSEAGTYDVTWSARPVQGAQLWLIAVQ